jgi:phosphoglycolate phosphatase-like HAD superfamily hydrolase
LAIAQHAKIQPAQKPRKSLSTAISAAMIPQNHPLDSLKTLFLFAARKIQVSPENCLLIEDSANGVIAGRAAGMTVVGLCAGSHARAGHAQKLTDAGAHFTAGTWSEVFDVMSALSPP